VHRHLCAPSHEKRFLPFHLSLPCGSVVSGSGAHGNVIIPLGCRNLTSGLSLMAKAVVSP
jgi:hypothetical protein